MDDFLQDLDEDVEGMQSVIYLLQNELQKYKASIKNSSNTENKESIPKVVNGVQKDDIINIETISSVSKTQIPTKLDKIKPDCKSCKHKKSKDSKNLNDCKSNQSKIKKAQLAEDIDQSGKNTKVHKSKHKSDDNKNEEKHKKSEKRSHNKDVVAQKKLKNDQPKSTEVQTPVVTVKLQNGS